MKYKVVSTDGVTHTLQNEVFFSLEEAQRLAHHVNKDTEHWASVYDENDNLIEELP